MGANIKRKRGMLIDMTMITEMTWRKDRKNILNLSGICRSVFSMSFENRLRIRPIGVDSKNAMLQRTIE